MGQFAPTMRVVAEKQSPMSKPLVAHSELYTRIFAVEERRRGCGIVVDRNAAKEVFVSYLVLYEWEEGWGTTVAPFFASFQQMQRVVETCKVPARMHCLPPHEESYPTQCRLL